MTDIKAAQPGFESLPLDFGAIVVIHCKTQQVCAELVHVLLIDKWRHGIENILMNGLYSFLLTFRLTLIEVIYALLIGRTGRSS
jgi:hypothetical protein